MFSSPFYDSIVNIFSPKYRLLQLDRPGLPTLNLGSKWDSCDSEDRTSLEDAGSGAWWRYAGMPFSSVIQVSGAVIVGLVRDDRKHLFFHSSEWPVLSWACQRWPETSSTHHSSEWLVLDGQVRDDRKLLFITQERTSEDHESSEQKDGRIADLRQDDNGGGKTITINISVRLEFFQGRQGVEMYIMYKILHLWIQYIFSNIFIRSA